MKYQIGDKLKILDHINDNHCGEFSKMGRDHLVIKSVQTDHYSYDVFDKNGSYIGSCAGHSDIFSDSVVGKHFKLIKGNSLNMSLISRFKNITRTEPEKTFVKAGIMDETLELTTEGQALFLSYMLDKHKDDFKKEVVDAIVAEMDEEKK